MSRGFREVRLGREQAQQGSTVAKAPAALAQHIYLFYSARGTIYSRIKYS